MAKSETDSPGNGPDGCIGRLDAAHAPALLRPAGVRPGATLRVALSMMLLACGAGQAQAVTIAGDAASSSVVTDRLAHRPIGVAADGVIAANGGLSRPAFEPSAGVFGGAGIQPALAPPQILGGGYPVMPTVREALSASVAATDLFADEPVGLGIVVHSGAGIAFSASSTVAVAGLGDAGRASGTNEFGTGANLAMAGRLAALMRSSVFIDTAMEPAATRAAQTAATGLQTVQGASMLTVYQALRDPAAVEDQTIERYAIAAPATAGPGPATADLLRLPLKISSSYGFLNSSLTVFSDDFGSFGGIGQSFNGLTALAMAEPASLFVVAVSLLGLAGLRRWRLWA